MINKSISIIGGTTYEKTYRHTYYFHASSFTGTLVAIDDAFTEMNNLCDQIDNPELKAALIANYPITNFTTTYFISPGNNPLMEKTLLTNNFLGFEQINGNDLSKPC